MVLLLPLHRRGGFTPSDVPQVEANALMAFYYATTGANWSDNTNWLSDPVVNNWFGVTVGGGHVTQINLSSNNLVGEFGDTLSPLSTNLTSLSLGNNSLTDIGTVTNLTNLTHLRLSNNSLTDIGTVTNLTNLTSLYLSNNSLTDIGTVTNLAGLITLSLNNNSFNQAGVDGILNNLYSAFPTRTGVNGTVNLSANAIPSGVYQTACPPTTGLEVKFELTNDICNVSPNHWATVTTDV